MLHFSAVCALVGCVMMGPRIGRFDKHGRPVPMPGHSVPLSALGGLILIFGFFACNGTKQVRLERSRVQIPCNSVQSNFALKFGCMEAAFPTFLKLDNFFGSPLIISIFVFFITPKHLLSEKQSIITCAFFLIQLSISPSSGGKKLPSYVFCYCF